MTKTYYSYPQHVMTANGIGGAIGKSAVTGEILVRHPKGVAIDVEKCAHVASKSGTNGWLAWYRSEDVKDVVK